MDSKVRDALERLHEVDPPCLEYLHPNEVQTRMNEFERLKHPLVSVEVIGKSRSGDWPLFAVILGELRAERKVHLWASQHHSPENEGAAAAFWFISLCINDQVFRRLLNDHVFLILPQQNPDGIVLEGNWEWMKDPSLESYLRNYQYDLRTFDDCEHGIVIDNERTAEMRPEPRAFKQFADRFTRIDSYLSSHSWDTLGGALFLVAGSSDTKSQMWSQRTATALKVLELDVQRQAPLSPSYNLPEIRSGFCKVPMLEEMSAQRPEVPFRLHTPQYVLQFKAAEIVAVAEPPVFLLPAMQDTSPSGQYLHGIIHKMIERTQELIAFDNDIRIQLHSRLADASRLSSRLLGEMDDRKELVNQWYRLLGNLPEGSASVGQDVFLRVKHSWDMALVASLASRVFEDIPHLHEEYERKFEEQLSLIEAFQPRLNSLLSSCKTLIAAVLSSCS